MPVILVYNPATNAVERYTRSVNEAMPYIIGSTLTVGEFRANSKSGVLWTDRRTMNAWNVFRRIWERGIYVGYAFKRIWEGGHDPQSQHYAGMAFDTGQNLFPAERNMLRAAAINSEVWSYVEPAYLTPTWVHFDKRLWFPACAVGGYPVVRYGSKGVYVLVLQDALSAIGYTGLELDGDFGPKTQAAVIRFQSDQGLAVDGVVGCSTWETLTPMASGVGM